MDLTLTPDALLSWLREDRPAELERLYAAADAARRENVGDAVHLRGLIEFSNRCRRQCAYCGIRSGNGQIPRYRLTREELLASARRAHELGYGTVVIQSGEDFSVTAEWWAEVIKEIKDCTPLAVTLSLGERRPAELALWKQSGADRYLLRFETGNPELYRRIHPDAGGEISDRMAILRNLRDLGYEVGSGVMVGVPGQTYADAARDLLLFRELDLDMIGIGPYLPHPQTPLFAEFQALPPRGEKAPADGKKTQIYPTAENARKMVALARLLCPQANIPSTTALATLDAAGREKGLQCGANVLMPNLTPARYRALYAIYPEKEARDADKTAAEMDAWFRTFNRRAGLGQGGRKR